jgi:hypothetical protein
MLTRSYSLRNSLDVFGNATQTTTLTENNYGEIELDGKQYFNLKSKLTETSSSGTDIFGNRWETIQPEKLSINYNLTEQNVWGVKDVVVLQSQKLEGGDIFGNTYTTTITNEYAIFYGEPMVVRSNSVREGTDIFGNATQATTVTTNNYGDIELGSKHYFNLASKTVETSSSGSDIFGNNWVTTQPEIISIAYGLTPEAAWGAIGVSVLESQKIKGQDIFGNTYTTEITNEYQIFYGEPMVATSTSIRESTDVFGNYSQTTTVTINTYGSISLSAKKYFNLTSKTVESSSSGSDIFGNSWTTTQPEKIALNYGLTTEGVWGTKEVKVLKNQAILGSDLFGGTYTTAITNEYQIFYGEPMVVKSNSLRAGTDIFGNSTQTTSVTENTYGEIELNSQNYFNLKSKTVTTASEGKDIFGNQWKTTQPEKIAINYGLIPEGVWGAKEIVVSTNQSISGSDIFGNPYTTTITNEYQVLKGEPMVVRSNSTRTGTDVFGNVTQTMTVTINNYGEITLGDKKYFNLTSKVVETSSSGSDIFGNSWTTTQPERISINYGQGSVDDRVVWQAKEVAGLQSQIISGSDVFGNLYTTTITNEYQVLKGEPMVVRSNSVREGTDIFGNHTKTATITTNNYGEITLGDKKYFNLISKKIAASSEGDDIFGNHWTTTQPEEINILYGQIKPNIWGAEAVTLLKNQNISGSDLFGGTYTTTITNEYSLFYGEPMVVKSTSIRTGIDIFGNSTQTATITTNSYAFITLDRKKYFSLKSKTIETSSSGSDIFGNNWSTTQPEKISLTYGLIPEGAWGVKEVKVSKNQAILGSDLFGGTYTTAITNEYKIFYGEPMVVKSNSLRTGIDIFGNSTKTTTSTTNEYGEIELNNRHYFNLKTKTIVTASEGKDIFGNQWKTTQPEIITIHYGQINGHWGETP